jgi:hypothetical protein
MNTLTPNRILMKGDEYRDNGTWKPVPVNDYGLQVMFTKYAEVRRPSEKTHKPISPDREPVKPAASRTLVEAEPATPAKAEKVKAPVPTPSGTGETPHASSYLPTVVSTKAHNLRETPDTANESPTEVPKRAASPTPYDPTGVEEIKPCPKCGSILCGGDPCVIHDPVPKPMVIAGTTSTTCNIRWHSTLEPECQWIGRNGTFKCRGLSIYKHGKGVIKMVPVGKRGEAKNAEIEFPVNAIGQIVDFLNKQKPT